jgi:hypothetical protein
MRRTAGLLGIALLSLVVVEFALQLLALAVPQLMRRASPPADGAAFRILCLGDSHTYGWGVERSEAYPAQLEQLLDSSSGRFQVVNLGVPSSNSSQLLNRLPGYLSRHRPDLLVVTIGANDAVNTAEHDGALPGVEQAGRRDWLWKLRLYRLLRYAAHQRRKVEAARDLETEVRWSGRLPWRSVEVRDGESQERYEHRLDFGNLLDPGTHEAILRRNLEAMVRLGREAGVPLVFASYAHDRHSLALANRIMSAMPEAVFVSQRVHPDLERRLPRTMPAELGGDWFFEDQHPKAPVYAAMAANLRDALVSQGFVPSANHPSD